MAENKGSPGLSKLARVISQRAENVAGKAERDLVLDFGSIKGDMSLLTNTFPIPIPRSDYHVQARGRPGVHDFRRHPWRT